MCILKDKTIIITGGSGQLGKAFAKECIKNEANVVIADIDVKKFHKTISDTGKSKILLQKCDITNRNNVIELIENTISQFKKIDALVNNAYPRNKNYGKKYEDVTYESFCENVNMHLGGYFLITKEISKIMMEQNRGNIINISSIYGFSAPRFDIYEGTNITMPVEYASIKGGIINLTRYLASYLGKYNIRVNSISPGGVFNNQPESFVRKYSEYVILGNRMANCDDLVGTLKFLLSDDSNYITGQNIIIDGGWSL